MPKLNRKQSATLEDSIRTHCRDLVDDIICRDSSEKRWYDTIEAVVAKTDLPFEKALPHVSKPKDSVNNLALAMGEAAETILETYHLTAPAHNPPHTDGYHALFAAIAEASYVLPSAKRTQFYQDIKLIADNDALLSRVGIDYILLPRVVQELFVPLRKNAPAQKMEEAVRYVLDQSEKQIKALEGKGPLRTAQDLISYANFTQPPLRLTYDDFAALLLDGKCPVDKVAAFVDEQGIVHITNPTEAGIFEVRRRVSGREEKLQLNYHKDIELAFDAVRSLLEGRA